MEWVVTYRSAGLVVVEIHFFSERFAAFAGVYEFSAESEAEADVVATAAPLPDTHIGGGGRAASVRLALHMRVVAGARLDRALRAGARHRVRDARARYRVDERRLSTTCCKETPS